MNNVKVLSPANNFGVIKYDLASKKVLSVNPVFNSFLTRNNLTPQNLILEIKAAVSQESAHISIGGVEFLVNTDTTNNIFSIFAHEVSTLGKDKTKISHTGTSLPVDELHKLRLLTLGEMTAGIIHDINNPLNIVNSGVELTEFFLDDLENANGSEEKEKILDQVKAQLKQIRSGTQRINEVSEGVRMLMHKNQIKFQEQELRKIINSSAACCISFLRQSGIEFTYKDTTTTKNLPCKESLLAQVFINMIKNSNDAIKNLPPHSRFIQFDVSENNTHFVIKISDGGKGISESLRNKIFEPFFTTKAMGEGTGIGLSLCRQIIDAHGGELMIDASAVNTTFIVTLAKNLKF